MLALVFALAADLPLDTARSPEGTLPDLAHETTFDGIAPKVADKFWQSWTLVTARFRKDNGEQRFVYANPAAYTALLAGGHAYPDGAMFAKIAFTSAPDPAFPASMEPQRVSRVQLMQKNAARYPDQAGWGYAIYPAKARQGPDDASIVAACHGCHQVVRDRDYVFSRAAFDTSGAPAGAPDAFAKSFTRTRVSDLDAAAHDALIAAMPEPHGKVAMKRMPLFAGSISESHLPLVAFARRDHLPYVLIDPQSHTFIATAPADTHCKNGVRIAIRLKGPPLVSYDCEH